VNDFVLFSVAGSGSLLSGWIFATWGWLRLIYVASGLVSLCTLAERIQTLIAAIFISQMVVYLFLFAWALGRVTTLDSEASEPLMSDGNARKDRFSTSALARAQRLQQDARQAESDGMERERTTSFSQRVVDAGRTMSFSIQNDPTAELVDEETPLRSISVA
jgi:hypothetical protein